jgi:hypothetical protein
MAGAGLVATVSSQGWLRTVMVVLATLLLTDAFGGADTRAHPFDRAAAALAMSLITFSWWTGVVIGWSYQRLSPVTMRT